MRYSTLQPPNLVDLYLDLFVYHKTPYTNSQQRNEAAKHEKPVSRLKTSEQPSNQADAGHDRDAQPQL